MTFILQTNSSLLSRINDSDYLSPMNAGIYYKMFKIMFFFFNLHTVIHLLKYNISKVYFLVFRFYAHNDNNLLWLLLLFIMEAS